MMLEDADSRSPALVANPTSGKPSLLANGREFLNVGIYSKRFACRESCYYAVVDKLFFFKPENSDREWCAPQTKFTVRPKRERVNRIRSL